MISIALATYNGEAYLQDQLRSFVSQKRLPDELIVSDDASADGTIAILEKFREQAPFSVSINRNQRNLGITRNFEIAVSLCKGDYIFLSDQDDVWLPGKISSLAEVLDSEPDTGLVFCNAQIVDQSLLPLGCDLWESFWFSRAEQVKVDSGRAFEVLLRHSVIAAMSMAFRRELKELILPFPDVWSAHDVWIALVAAAASGVKRIDKKLLKYRVHGESQTVGIHRMSLYEQYKTAKRQVKDDTFPNLLKLCESLLEKLSILESGKKIRLAEDTADLLQNKIHHTAARINMPDRIFKKVPIVWSEFYNHRYHKYSYGFKSMAQDLFLR